MKIKLPSWVSRDKAAIEVKEADTGVTVAEAIAGRCAIGSASRPGTRQDGEGGRRCG